VSETTNIFIELHLRVFDPSNNVIVDTAPGGNISTNLTLPATGRYTILIRDNGADETGGYSVSLQCLVEPCPVPPPTLCNNQVATIVGTVGNDVLTGTAGNDVIHGLGGNDTIFGLGGNDIICGGQGNDTLNGGRGNDKLFGERGNDKLFGERGNDTLNGGLGVDSCSGGLGTDIHAGGCETRQSIP
jgi:Ca2+-binding RTX toxin-like protein